MSDFSMFMSGNALPPEGIEYVASQRFVDPKTKKPMAWKLAPISSDMDEMIRKESTKMTRGKRGQTTTELDTDKYINKMCAASTVYPNLNDAELQDSYGVKDSVSLLKKMLYVPGELTMYKEKVMEVNGFDTTMEELVEEAKN